VSVTANRENAKTVLADECLDYYCRQQGAICGWLCPYMPIGRSFDVDLMVSAEQRKWMLEKELCLIFELYRAGLRLSDELELPDARAPRLRPRDGKGVRPQAHGRGHRLRAETPSHSLQSCIRAAPLKRDSWLPPPDRNRESTASLAGPQTGPGRPRRRR